MHDVITVGSGVIDCFVDTGDRLFRNAKDGHVKVPFGSKITVENLVIETGGGGTNTAVSLRRMGFRVAWIGKTGYGQNAQRIMRQLRNEKVDTSLVCREKGGRTGFSVILDAKGHDRTVLAFKGSNDDLEWKDVDKNRINSKWMYCSSMAGKSFRTLEKIVEFAKSKGIKIAFNPSSYLAVKGPKFLSKIISRTNIIVMNDEEAFSLTGEKNIAKALAKLHEMGPETAVITEGSKGCHAYDGKRIYYAKPHKVKVVEATGAGDAFASAFLAGIMKGKGIEFSLRLGTANAESVIQHYGAKNRLLTWNEAIRKI